MTKNEAWMKVAKQLFRIGQINIKNIDIEDVDEFYVCIDWMKKARGLYLAVDKLDCDIIDENMLPLYGKEAVFDFIRHIVSDELAAEMVSDVFNKED